MHSLNWKDPKEWITRHFTVKEAIWLPSWGRLANSKDGLDRDAKDALTYLFEVMEAVREVLDAPIKVHCAFRPLRYNAEIGGAPQSAHIARILKLEEQDYPVAAVDFSVNLGKGTVAENCDQARKLLLPILPDFLLRMEWNQGCPWVHLDTKPVEPGASRIFKVNLRH